MCVDFREQFANARWADAQNGKLPRFVGVTTYPPLDSRWRRYVYTCIIVGNSTGSGSFRRVGLTGQPESVREIDVTTDTSVGRMRADRCETASETATSRRCGKPKLRRMECKLFWGWKGWGVNVGYVGLDEE